MKREIITDKETALGEPFKNMLFILRTLTSFIVVFFIISSLVDINIKLFLTDLVNLLENNFGSIAWFYLLLMIYGVMQPISNSIVAMYVLLSRYGELK